MNVQERPPNQSCGRLKTQQIFGPHDTSSPDRGPGNDRDEVSHSSLSKSKTLDEIENWEELPGMDQALGVVLSLSLVFRALEHLDDLGFG